MTPPPLYKELSLLLPTSGSTGSSKLVRHSYKNVEANARNVSLLFGLDKHERALATLPIYYTMGLSVISSHIYAGATILLTGKSLTDGKFWTFMKEHRATSFTGVPYSFEVLQKLRFFRMDIPHLQLITQGGGKMKNYSVLVPTMQRKMGKNLSLPMGRQKVRPEWLICPPIWQVQRFAV